MKPLEAVEVGRQMGSAQPMDVIWCNTTGPIIVSDRVLALWQEEGVTGWDTYPVRLLNADDKHGRTFHGVTITGRCGPIDPTRSEVFIKQMPAKAAKRYRGLYFDVDTWDGRDMFMTEGRGLWHFVTEKVRRLFEKNGIRNVRFTSLRECEIPTPWWREGSISAP